MRKQVSLDYIMCVKVVGVRYSHSREVDNPSDFAQTSCNHSSRVPDYPCTGIMTSESSVILRVTIGYDWLCVLNNRCKKKTLLRAASGLTSIGVATGR